MIRKLLLVVCLIGLLVAGCTPTTSGGDGEAAAAYCTDNGGTLETRTDATGTEFEMCILEDGEECVPVLFMEGECGPVDEDAAEE